ncbi:MAG: hypothetical protein A2033_05955 [Bacteroidetes bacterium GWA2_31_9]|nr:MAG: hypothetical protein A2033_05955 [Bacteroidetes bacterium GWA2_31_9]
MRRSNTQPISAILKLVFSDLNIEKKLKEVELMNSWEEVTGKFIAAKTKNMYIKNKVLYVSIESSVMRNELILLREGLINRLNEKCGQEVITGIVIR